MPVGSSREQVLLALGTPSTTATFDNEVFYYISQTRTRPVAFMKPKLVDQRILAVYFDEDGRVDQLANYGCKDGKVVRLHLAHDADRRQGPDLPRPAADRRRQADPSTPAIGGNALSRDSATGPEHRGDCIRNEKPREDALRAGFSA